MRQGIWRPSRICLPTRYRSFFDIQCSCSSQIPFFSWQQQDSACGSSLQAAFLMLLECVPQPVGMKLGHEEILLTKGLKLNHKDLRTKNAL